MVKVFKLDVFMILYTRQYPIFLYYFNKRHPVLNFVKFTKIFP